MSPQTVTSPEAAIATVIDSPARAEALAEHLLDPARTKPVVVVTTAAGRSRPYIDVDEIIGALSELADVYVLPTGGVTFALGDRLPEKTQVYGGAGRVYPVGTAWRTDPYVAPLRFAFDPAQGPGATDKLIADALGAAHLAGLDTRRIGATLVHVEGEVKALIAPSRAWVRTDDGGDAAIWQDLLLPGLALDRAFRSGMRISGALDVEERRIDVSASLRKPADALAGYAVGIVVLGRVVELDNIAVLMELYPGVRAEMSANEVTGNPLDRLTAVMSVGEVLPVRVTVRGRRDGRGWRLSTLDVEDTEAILVAPSLLPDGPPWLKMADVALEAAMAAPSGATGPARVEGTGQPEASFVDAQPQPDLLSPHPDLLPPHPDALSPQPDALSVSATSSEVVPVPLTMAADERASLHRQIAELDGMLLNARRLGRAVQVELDGFRAQARESYARVQQLVTSANKARTDLRLEKQKSQRLDKQVRAAKIRIDQESNEGVLFIDAVEQFRYEVDVAYAHRIPAGDKAARPRRELRLGSDFLATLASVEGVERTKVVAVTVEVITDLVNELEGRDLHPLRAGRGPADREVVRDQDGARCMRVALQTNTASARRLHYWKVGDAIELSRVVKHDDMTP
jgi:hypothetical protein